MRKLWLGRVIAFVLLLSLGAPLIRADVATPPASESAAGRVSGVAAAPASGPSPTTAASTNPWQRMVIIGASVSAGFTLSEPLGGPVTPRYRLNHYLDAAVLAPHAPVRNFGNALFFMQPEFLARAQITQARQADPTLVVAVDYLFWFCYGDAASDAERLQRLETGLKLLETIPCPVLIGNIPDASSAANGILRPAEIPSRAVMAEANRRLAAWAAGRPKVKVIGLAEFFAKVLANEAVSVRDCQWRKGSTSVLLQPDRLHTSSGGCAALALLIGDAALALSPRAAVSDVCWDAEAVLKRGLENVQEKNGPASRISKND